MFLSKNSILQSAKQFHKVDSDLRGQNVTFFFQAFFTKIFMFLSKNGISRSAKQFCEVDSDLWGQIATFFFKVFFDNNFDVSVKKQHFAEC
jgi:hypothetical protein